MNGLFVVIGTAIATILVFVIAQLIVSQYRDESRVDDNDATRSVEVDIGGYTYRLVLTSAVSASTQNTLDNAVLDRLVWLRCCGRGIAAYMRDDAAMHVLATCIIAESASAVGKTVDKGRVISICIRDKDTGVLFNSHNTLFVFLHEVAHAITTSVNHTMEFRRNFDRILNSASALGLYDATRLPSIHCGKEILPPPPM